MYNFAAGLTVALFAFFSDGCRSNNWIYPQERVIADPETSDFGFVGTWQESPTQHRPNADLQEDFSISMQADGVYSRQSKALVDFSISLRATELNKESGYAILDVDVVADEKHFCRYLALAKREENHLYVWWIESKNIAAKLHDSGFSGVIEHGPFSTRVYVKPVDLIDCVRKHSKDLVGEPSRFRLKSE